jgi:DJ-1 family protein
MAQVLVVVAPGAEEIETIAVADVLVRAGQQVLLGGLGGTILRGSRNLPIAADRPLEELAGDAPDLLFLPGGMGSARACRDDPRVQDLLSAQLAAGRWTALICAAPIALLPRGLARGRRLTCHPGSRGDLVAGGAEWIDRPVVRDGRLVTSQGPGTAVALGLCLAALLASVPVAATVAAGMLAPMPDLAGIT